MHWQARKGLGLALVPDWRGIRAILGIGQGAIWNGDTEAEDFVKLNALRLRIAANKGRLPL